MQETSEQTKLPLDLKHMGPVDFLHQVIHGVGVVLGLGLLWTLESVRNVFFRGLDRFNIKSRPPRKVSAFPPRSPRRRKAA